ncbi:putative phage abortive infection protein [Bacillus mycoides]|uniref:Uncharacterized protein n=1 Tax=Bacillus mycoides TaxID=1405 RepID=A0A4U3A103_BACMY|nr:putative phage abortive infection protein [Bacillus mycoides]TKI80732.1 hypothetical protein FC701_27485 [Bacillus mycoides]
MSTLISYFIVFIVISLLLVFVSFKMKKVNLGWIFICCIMLLLGGLIFWLYIGKFEFINDVELFRTLVPMCALVITTTSVIITVQSTNKTALANKETKTETTIMNMIKLNNDIIKDIDKEIFPKVLKQINEEFIDYNFMLRRGREFIRSFFKENQQELLSIINSINLASYDEQLRGTLEYHREKYIKAITKRERRYLHKFWFTVNEMSVGYQIELSKNNKQNILRDPFTSILVQDTDFYKKIKHEYAYKQRVLTHPVQYKEMRIVCDTIFDKYYHELGHFFRNTHRIIKIINSNFEYSDRRKSEYIGILRAQLSEEILLIIFYNAIYSRRGIGLGRELIGNNFFGNDKDFPYYVNSNDPKARKNFQEPQHFRFYSIILPAMDIEIMSTILTTQRKKKVQKLRKEFSDENLIEEFERIYNDNISENFKKSFKRTS